MTTPREEWTLDTHRLGRRVLVFDRLDSTNNVAARLAADPANDGLVVLADEQTAGRGQYGRTWLDAPRQSVLLSLVVSPPPETCRPAVLTAWAAVAVCAAIQQTIGEATRIKWPNDVLLHERKVCGILIESATGAFRSSMVVGIGLNVQQSAETFASAGLTEATSLAQWSAHPLDTHAVAADLIRRLDHEYEALCRGDWSTLEETWRHHLGLLGKHVLAVCPEADYAGRLRKLDFCGLELERASAPPLVLSPEKVRNLSLADEPEQG
jgi:BirA family biotin operon repressor/biotin-[acetyl-CoA-carboxylase] ligase